MDQFTTFLLQHWMLSTALLLIIGLLFAFEFRNKLTGVESISPQQATQFINHHNAVIIDVRPADRFQQGHIIAAINIPYAEIETHQAKLKNYQAKPIIIVCDTGQTSAKVAALLKKQGFTQSYSLSGGLAAWRNSQLPLITK